MVDAITVFTHDLLEEKFGPHYDKSRHQKIDLSGPEYSLESIEAFITPKLSKAKLRELDLSKNMLADINGVTEANGFRNLTYFRARKNMISTVPEIQLGNLVELNLSTNDMTGIPPLKGLPKLTSLNLSRNRIEGTWSYLADGRNLTRIDLSYNQFVLRPSQLEDEIHRFGKYLHQLTWLRVEGNPFCVCFKEYPVFFAKGLRRLEKLDGVEISENTRMEIDAQTLLAMDRYDDEFARRKAISDDRNRPRARDVVDLRDLSLERVVQLLNDALCDPANAQRIVTNCSLLLHKVYTDPKAYVPQFMSITSDKAPSVAHPQLLNHFLRNAQLAYERFEVVRDDVLKMLAYAAAIPDYNIGCKCVEALGSLLSGGADSEEQVQHVLAELVLPLIEEEDLSEPRAKSIMQGLAHVGADRIGEGVVRIVPALRAAFLEDSGNIDVAVMFAGATRGRLTMPEDGEEEIMVSPGAVTGAEDPAVHKKVLLQLDNKALADDEDRRELWLAILELAENFTRYAGSVEQYTKAQLHVQLMSRIKKIMEETDDLATLSWVVRKTCARMLRCVNAMCEQSEKLLHECCDSYMIVDTHIKIARQYVVDPLMLTESVNGIILCLQNEVLKPKYLTRVVEDLSKVAPLLQYLTNKKYPDMFKQACSHSEETRHKVPEAPPMKLLKCELCKLAFRAIIRLIVFFMSDDDPQCEIVNEALNGAARESVLLQLLCVPDDDLRLDIMKCIGQVPLGQIESEEMSLLIKLLADTRNLAAGRTEDVVAAVIRQLMRLAQADGDDAETGEIFLTKHSKMALAVTFEILSHNAARITYGNDDEENEKLGLSLACVEFMMVASNIHEMRPVLRNDDFLAAFMEIVLNEDKLHSFEKQDLNLEQTWLGRDICNLLYCLQENSLSARGKVRFRLLSRIASVLQGEQEPEGIGRSVHAIMETEALMWDEAATVDGLQCLSDETSKDRDTQVKNFMASDGISLLLRTLMETENAEAKKEYEALRDEATDLAMKLKAKTMDMQEQIEKEEEDAAAQDQPEEIDPFDAEGDETANTPGQTILMYCMHQQAIQFAEESCTLFSVATGTSAKAEDATVQKNGTSSGAINKSYAVAAVLRILHALLVVPVSDETLNDALKCLRRPGTMHTLLGIVTTLPPLPCHLAAKFFRVCACIFQRMLFRTDPIQFSAGKRHDLRKKEEEEQLLTFETVAKYALEKLAPQLLESMRQVTDRKLILEEQVLCAEISRAMATMLRVIPHVEFNAQYEDVQRSGVVESMQRMIPEQLIRLFIGIILYALIADTEVDMCEYAADLLAHHLSYVPALKYPLLESLASAQVFQNKPLRESFVSSLLGRMNEGLYGQRTQKLLQEETKVQHRLLHLAYVDMPEMLGWSEKAFVLTDKNVFLLALPTGQRCEVCPPENFCPKPPTIASERLYTSLKRIVVAYGGQMLSLLWDTGWEILVFRRVTQCAEVAQVLQQLSGDTIEERTAVERSEGLLQAIREHAPKDKVECATFAKYNGSVAYAVLTAKDIFVFDPKVYNYDPDSSSSPLTVSVGPGKVNTVKSFVLTPEGPVLEIDCGGTTYSIEFRDDSGREEWRRGLRRLLPGAWEKKVE